MKPDDEAPSRESELRLRLAIEAGRMAVWDFDVRTNTLTGTDDLNRLLGFPAGQPLRLEDVRARYYPGDHERMREQTQACLARGERFIQAEYRFLWPDGSLHWHLMRAEVFTDENRVPTKVLGIVIDISDRKRAEEALVEREGELRAAINAAALGTYTFDHRTRSLKSSPRLREIYGYAADHDITLEDLSARYHPEDLEEIAKLSRGAADPAQLHHEAEFRLLLPGGMVRWVQGRGEYARDEHGNVLLSRGIAMDITGRKRWEEQQRLLLNELNHRVKNTLATVQGIAAQSFRPGEDPVRGKEAFTSRLIALAQAHDVLTRENWEGAILSDIVASSVQAFQRAEQDRFRIRGGPVRVSAKAALAFALGVHELATNAVKYGSLSNGRGRVEIEWELSPLPERPDRLTLSWKESGGPAITAPDRKGFGSRLLEQGLAGELEGSVQFEYNPEGLVCLIEARTGNPAPDRITPR